MYTSSICIGTSSLTFSMRRRSAAHTACFSALSMNLDKLALCAVPSPHGEGRVRYLKDVNLPALLERSGEAGVGVWRIIFNS